MDKDTSLIERKIIMIDKLIPTKFEAIKIPIAVEYKIIYGRYVPIKFKEILKYIAPEFEIIKIPIITST